MNTFRPGYIALISVLILSAIALAVGIGLATHAVSQDQMDVSRDASIRAYAAATACAEHALIALKGSLLYTGNQTLVYSGDSCTILTVGGAGNLARTVKATSTVSGATRKILIQVEQVNPRMIISSWTDVVNF